LPLDNLTILFGGPNNRVTSLALVLRAVTCFSAFSSKGTKFLPRPKTAQPVQIDAISNMLIKIRTLFIYSWSPFIEDDDMRRKFSDLPIFSSYLKDVTTTKVDGRVASL